MPASADARAYKVRDRPGGHPDPLHILQVFQPDHGGVPAYVTSLAHGLRAAGWQVSVACPAGSRACELLAEGGIDTLPLHIRRSPSGRQDTAAVRALVQWCRQRDVSVIHGHSTKAGMLAALTGRAARVPSVYTPHGWAFERHVATGSRAAFAVFERQLAHRYHAGILTVSGSEKRAAERWRVAPLGRIQAVRTGLPHSPPLGRASARRALGIDAQPLTAAWVGRIGPQKRPGDVARIARRLGGEVQIVMLCHGIHGTPVADELLSAGVKLLDSDVEPQTVYAAADLLLHTSAWEALPLVVLEAMGARLPVVAYDVGGVGEQVLPGRTGYLVAPGDIEMMSECVLALARRPQLCAAMGEAGHRRSLRLFSYEAMLRRISDTYLAVAAQNGQDGDGWRRWRARKPDRFDGTGPRIDVVVGADTRG